MINFILIDNQQYTVYIDNRKNVYMFQYKPYIRKFA